jgi:D-glycero-alpha-D-manno-heptose 1-phosphate guanylyltransferase
MEAIILAGGFGTRLRSVVSDLPKPLAPVGGRPFLAILLDQLVAQGFKHVVLSVGYKHELIQQAFGNKYQNLTLSYAVEEVPLGTGGAICLAASLCKTTEVFVLNGDSYVDLDFAAMRGAHRACRAQLSICAVTVPEAGRYGCVQIEADRIVGFSEKGTAGPGLINAGVYLFAPSLVVNANLPKAFSVERDFLMARLHQLSPLAFVVDGLFIDIGVPEDYARADAIFRRS